jgi:hypothetical protein
MSTAEKKRSIDITKSPGFESEDESENDENKAKNIHDDESGAEEVDKKEKGEVPAELQKKKRLRQLKPFSESDLEGPFGLAYVYENFPSLCKSNGHGHEAADLNNLIEAYAEWAFRMYPGLAFPDVLSRTEILCSRGTMRESLERLRTRERSRFLVSRRQLAILWALIVSNNLGVNEGRQARLSLRNYRGTFY